MKRESLLIWAVIILAVLNISTLATVLFHQKPDEMAAEFKKLEANAEKYSGRYFRDQLNLDQEQMEKFREFNPPFRRKALDISEALVQTRRAMLAEMASSHSDTLKLNALADSVGHLHSHLKKLTWHYYLNLKNICNAGQKESLEKLFSEIFINDIPMGHPGRGNPGWRRGRNQ